jgi:hypothetical protein
MKTESKTSGKKLNIQGFLKKIVGHLYLKGPKHDQVECGFFNTNQTHIVW